MTEKNQHEQNAADRQVELLINALESAKKNGGVWLNPTGKTKPQFYPKGVTVSPFNSLTLALHSDQNQCKTNQYTLFSEAKKRGESVKGNEKGVPFIWYNWNEYTNKNNPEDKISRTDYLKLAPEQQEQYKGVRSREMRILFNIDQTTLPFVSKEAYADVIKEHGSSDDRGVQNDNQLTLATNDLLLKARDNMVDVRMSDNGMASFNKREDFIAIPSSENYANAEDRARDVVAQLINATGHSQRLNREGIMSQGGKVASEDVAKQNALVSELATGAKLLEMGIPAKLSPESMKMVDYWQRELKENPCLIDSIETDVNNAVSMVNKMERGEKIEKKPTLTEQRIAQLHDSVNKHFYIADEIKDIPNKDTKEMVIVRDKAGKTADVVLPAGASLSVDNEVPGMNKTRIETALKKEGFDSVKFYNPDGIHGYRPDDSQFEGKEVSVSRLSNWSLKEVAQIDVSDAVKRSSGVEFDKILMLKDDAGKWAMYMKPQNENSVAVYPNKNDVNLFFNTIRQGNDEKSEQVRLDMAQKYYNQAKENPAMKVDLFKSNATSEELSRIERVNIFKTKEQENKPSRLLCIAKIAGMEKIPPREVSQEQWQRLWLADDMRDFKTHLAASLFADVLRQGKTESVGLGTDKTEQEAQTETKEQTQHTEFHEENDKQEQKQEEAHTEYHQEEDKQVANEKKKEEEKKNSPEQKEKEKQEEKAKEEKTKAETKAVAAVALTPMLRQFLDLKKKHPNALLLFRCGDFYETYKDDAEKASKILGITLTRSTKQKDDQGKPLAMAGFPYHALDTYLPKLIRAGQRVAICDQIEAPKQTTKRGISEMAVPGTAMEKELKDQSEQKHEVNNEETQSRGIRR